MTKNKSFTAFAFITGLLADLIHTKLHVVSGENIFDCQPGSTFFVFQQRGFSYINSEIPLKQNCFAALTSGYLQTNSDSKVLIVERVGYVGVFQLGGALEETGRLKYIDGCTDSLLIPPVKKGDACLNHLHFPSGITQTMHTHPSVRVGIVTKGSGECLTPYGNIPLREGMVFIIHQDGEHCFKTFDEGMDVVAYHPDSDFGATDEEHPMINKTIVDGVSAKHIDEIRTK